MKAYMAQLPPLGWVGLVLPVLVIGHAIMTALATLVLHGAIPAAVCNFLRLL